MIERPQLWVLAGPNGAGKSCLAEHFVKGRLPIVNPDIIAQALPRRAGGRLAEADAGRMAIRQRLEHISAGRSFAFETTLSGETELRAMRTALDTGFKTNLVFVGISRPELAQSRVAERVARGGHDVPPEAITRRYYRAIEALPKAAALAERVIIFDNSDERHHLVLVHENGQTKFHAPVPLWATNIFIANFLTTLEIKPIKTKTDN